MKFDREIYFDSVRGLLFGDKLTQQQVDGQSAILTQWEMCERQSDDTRHLAYMLATTLHETASTMWPIEEYGKGEGMSYGKPDPETGQTYYGRGYVQLTWRDNYARADKELDLEGDDSCEWHAENALDPAIAANIMFRGMWEGWFRSGNDLFRYFGDDTDDAYGAREIINGDKHIVPSWSNGVSIGNLIKGYHEDFLTALEASEIEDEEEEGDDGHVPPPSVLWKIVKRLIERRPNMQPYLAMITPVGGVATPPIAPGGPPPQAGWGPGFPTNPIAPGGQPPGIWGPGSGYPTHPIAPGGPPPTAGWGPGFPTNPIAPGGQPPMAGVPVFPSNPIVIPGVPEKPPVAGQPIAPPDYILVYYPGVGWIKVNNPNAEEAQPK